MAWPTRYLFTIIFRPLLLLLLATVAGSAVGCAAKLQLALVSSLIEDVSAATARLDDPELVATGVPTFLLLLEGLLETNPNDRKLLLSAAEAYTTYAALIENDDLPRARRLYRRAKEYGIRALPPQQAQVLRAPYAKFAAAIEEFNDSDLPAVFWTASSWGAWISISTESMATLAELPKVIALMHWVLARDDSYQNGSPHVFLGVYHSALPPMLGGNPEKAAHHFDRALAISEGRQLIFYVLKAKFYARRTFDRPLYESLLNKVLTSPIDTAPDFTLQNAAAQDQARILLGQIDDFF